MSESLRHKTYRGTVWSGIERFSVQGIQFVVMIVMARILTPSDYGLVGMIAIFIAISQSLIDSGFSQALIRKQDRSEIDNSTVFYFNIVVGLVLYILLFMTAPLIADFYSQPILIPITRLIGLSLVFNSLAVVQRAIFTIRLNFKTQALATLSGAIVSGIIGIYMAYKGFGVWSIVCQQLVNIGIGTILLWVLSRWKPIFRFSWVSFKELFNFGSKLLAAGLINTLYNNTYLIVVGKVFNSSDLGYYTRAQQFSELIATNSTGIIQRVTYPVLCSIQSEEERLSKVYREILSVTAFVIFPIMVIMAAVSNPLINVLLTSKWNFSATLMIPLCLAYMWHPVHAINLNLLQVKGRSDLFLKLEIIKKILGIGILCLTIPFGLIPMCWGILASSLIALVINTRYTGMLIHLGFFAQMKDLMPSLSLSLIVGVIVFITMSNIETTSWIKLIIGLPEGFIIYFIVAKIFKFRELTNIRSIMSKK